MEISTYQLELSAGGYPADSSQVTVESIAEVQAFVTRSLTPGSVLIVTHLKCGADHGNFLIFLNTTDQTYVRLLEHRGFYATRQPSVQTGRTVRFMDGGFPFEVDENATLPLTTAKAALDHWLATGEQYPEVYWHDE